MINFYKLTDYYQTFVYSNKVAAEKKKFNFFSYT